MYAVFTFVLLLAGFGCGKVFSELRNKTPADQRDIFRPKSLRKRLLDNKFVPCWLFSTFQSTKSVENWQKLHKNFEIWKILGFLSFSVWIWYIFHLENSHYLFGKAYWTTNSCHSCHVERFQHSNPRSLSKIWQKLHENVKNRKILEFFLSFLG